MAVHLLLLLLGSAWAVCNNTNEDKCKIEPDCPHLNSCSSDGCCVHKDLMPLAAPEAGGTILVFVLAGMSNAGGIGGGPIMTAFELILFTFPTKLAIPLSQCIITAGGVISLAIRMFLRHPTKNRPLLEYHVSMIIIPPILLGSTYGVMANKVLPNWLILALLTLVLIFLTVMTYKNGIKMYKHESQVNKEKLQKKDDKEKRETGIEIPEKNLEIVEGEMFQVEDELKVPLQKEDEVSTPHKVSADDKAAVETGRPLESDGKALVGPQPNAEEDNRDLDLEPPKAISNELKNIYARESRQFPLIPILWLAFVVTYVALGLSIRGGGGTSFAGIAFCGEAFKIFFGLWSTGLLILCFLPVFYLLRLKATYDRVGYEYDEFDIRWTKMKCFNVWMAGLAGGFGGSLLGFGASLVVAPILVQWKMRAPQIGPTAALMTVVGSAISVMQYAEQNSLNYPYGGWLALIGFIGSLVGVISITALMKKLGRPSLLVLVLATVLGIAMLLVPIYTLITIIQQDQEGKLIVGLSPYC